MAKDLGNTRMTGKTLDLIRVTSDNIDPSWHENLEEEVDPPLPQHFYLSTRKNAKGEYAPLRDHRKSLC